jgi:hypothetical protein
VRMGSRKRKQGWVLIQLGEEMGYLSRETVHIMEEVFF